MMSNTTTTSTDNILDKSSATADNGVGMLRPKDTTNKLRSSINIDAVMVESTDIAAPEVMLTNPIDTASTDIGTGTGTGTGNITSTAANPTTTTTTAAQYSVPVKSEYILPERPSSLPSTQRFLNESKNENVTVNDKTNSDDRRDSNNDRSQQQEPRNRKQRGKQNKKRPRDVKISDEYKICRAILRGEPCPYVTTTTTVLEDGTTKSTTQSTCRYIHDLSIYLQTRPPDIQPVTISTDGTISSTTTATPNVTCPIFQLYQYCPYGIMCRFGSCHIDMKTGQNINHQQTNAVTTASSSSSGFDRNVTNILSNTLQTSLRKNTYPFQCQRRKHERTAVAIATIPKSNETQEDHSNTNGDSIVEPGPEEGTSMSTIVDMVDDTSGTVINGDTETKSEETTIPSKADDHQTSSNNNYSAYPTKTRKLVDFSNKVYVAPLTTVGNLPFRRIMKEYGADITCGEMALATNLLEGKASEWALIKRHSSETIFGIQLAAGYPDIFTRTMELIEREDIQTDFVDLNLGCPIDLVCQKGGGAALMQREKRLQSALQGIVSTLHKCPITIKMRTGWDEKCPTAHDLVHKIQNVWGYNPNNGVNAIMIHGRSRLQRYSREANWDYIGQIATSISPTTTTAIINGDEENSLPLPTIPIIGNGDIFTYVDYQEKVLATPGVLPCAMLGRGALIKPWLPKEIKEMKHYDISASERFDILRNFVNYGLEHWGTDQQGVNNCRRFLLEWLSFLHRYVPVGLLEYTSGPQRLNQRPPPNLCGRNDLETLFMSNNCYDWIKISEMLLGPVPDNFHFEPKHKANSY